MRKVVKTNKELEVKKSEHLVNARYTLNPLAIKFLTTIIANIKKEDDVDKEYIFRLKEFKELLGTKGNSIYKYVEIAVEELLKNPLKIPLGSNEKGKPKFLTVSWVSSAIYDDGEISFLVDKRLKPFLIEVKEKYLKYKLENILSLKSGYSIKLYEILKDNFNQNSRYNRIAKFKISVEDFKEKLEIPNSYRFNNIKVQILEKSKQEFEKYTDIIFEYEEIKKGRKVIEIQFIIYKNITKDNKTSEPLQVQENKKEILLEVKENKIINNWNKWREELLNKGNLIILLKDKKFELKNNYLWQNKELLTKEQSFKIWQELYENIDNLKIMSEDEYLQEQIKKAQERENKYQKIKELKEQYEYLIVKINEEHKEANVVDIQFNEENNIFKLYMSVYGEHRTFCQHFESLEKLEEFLKICNDSYLRNKNKNVSNEVDNNLVQKVKGLKDKYINKQLLIEIDENEKLEAKVLDIKINSDDIGLDLQIEEGEEIVESFELNDDEINRLEKFLKVCNEACLKTQTNSIKNKLSSVIKKF